MTTKFDQNIIKLKTILNENATKKHISDENIHFNKVVYYQLIDIRNAIEYAGERQFSNENLSILEDICMGININLSLNHSLQSMLLTIYHDIIIRSPGYVIRNVLNAMITICNHKSCVNIAKDTAIQVISFIMFYKPSDCGNQISDILQIIVKLMKINDVKLRISSVKTLISIVKGSQHKIEDLHSEILKQSLKYATDKIVEIRLLTAEVVKYIALYSNGGKTTTIEAILTPSLKGLEDEATTVQDMYCQVVATIFMEQIQQYIEALEQSKVGAARGSGNSTTQGDSPMKVSTAIRGAISKRISLSSLAMMSSKKGIVDTWDFKSVVVYLHKQILSTVGLLRISYIRTLGYLTESLLEVCSTEDFEWLLASNLEMLSSPVLQGLNYEEMVYFRCRFSHLIRCSITSKITEPQLIVYANQLIKHISTIDATSRPASVSLVADIVMVSPLYLKHSSFTVRSTTAQLIASTSAITPMIAIEILQSNLLSLRLQIKELLALDAFEDENQVLEVDLSDPEQVDNDHSSRITPEEQYPSEHATNHPGASASTGQTALGAGTSNPAPGGGTGSHGKKSLKELERLHHMYIFHGHTLVISTILKHAPQLLSGLPTALISEIYEFGLEMFSFNVLNSPLHIRSISCSIVRAGSLIVSSCCSMGYMIAKIKLPELLNGLKTVFDCYCQSNNNNNAASSTTATTTVRSQDLVYEVMCVEAALVCISTLLLFCPESLTLESQCLYVLVEGLESAFRTLKSKYQSKLKYHFRLKTLYAILLECFSWLPPGCYPLSSQGVFVEALRVFRDSVSLGFECTCIHEFLTTEFSILKHGTGQSSMISTNTVPFYTLEAPMSENMLMLKLENHSIALQKKESEAFLSIFSKDHENGLTFNDLFATSCDVEISSTSIDSTAPCAHLDTRTFDAALLLIAATFTHQSNDYQDKAIQLCVQALAQFTKPEAKSSLSLFSSDEEKKKKDRKNFITQCSVLAFISAVIRAYPTIGVTIESPSSSTATVTSNHEGMDSLSKSTGTLWMSCVVDMLFTMLTHSSYIIRSGSAYSLSLLAMKIHQYKITEECCFKIRSTIINSLMLLDKKTGDVAAVGDYSGYLITLASFWKVSQHLNDVKSVILTTIFDCLRKVTSPLQFRAHGLLALSTIVDDYLTIVNNKYHYKLDKDLNYMTLINTESLDLLDKVATVLEAQLSNIAIVPSGLLLSTAAATDTMELYEVCLLRLANTSSALSLQISKESNQHNIAHELHIRFYSICTLCRNNPFNVSSVLLNESVKLIPLIVPIDNEGKYSIFFLEWFNKIVLLRKEYSFDGLYNVLQGIDLLLVQYPTQACELGIGGSLFVLLDYFFSLMNFSSPSCYAGIEIKRGMMEQTGNNGYTSNKTLLACLSKCINVIYNFISADVKQSIDCRSAYWILFCRAIILNLHSTSKVTSNDIDTNTTRENVVGAVADEDHFEEENDVDHQYHKATNNAQKNMSMMSLVSYITYCRDDVLTFVPALDFCRVQVKCVAMRCISIAFSFIQKNSIHTDLALARVKTKEALQSIDDTNKLSSIPKYIVLFLTDLINISCLCVTFMIDDKPILILQSESMQLLHHIIALFQSSIDPDHKMTKHASISYSTATSLAKNSSSSYDAEEMIIHQFISQITSAIRVCLTSSKDHRTVSSDLVYSSGMLLCTLLRSGLISDKIVLKRLLKLILEYFDSDERNEVTTTSLLVLPMKYQGLMSTEYASDIHVSYVLVVTVIYALVYNHNAYDLTKNRCVTSDITSTVVSCFEPYTGLIQKLGLALTLDTIRFEHFLQSQGNSIWFLDHMSKIEFPHTIHPHRGGYAYQISNACVQIAKKDHIMNHLQALLTHAFPLNLYNYLTSLLSSSSDTITIAEHIDLFLSIVHQSLVSVYKIIDVYNHKKQNININPEDICRNDEINISTNEYINKYSIDQIIEQKHTLIACFISIAQLQLKISTKRDILIDTNHWKSVLSYLTLRELLNKSTTDEESICMILEIITSLFDINTKILKNNDHIQLLPSLSIHMIILIAVKTFHSNHIFKEQEVVKYMDQLTNYSEIISQDMEYPQVQESLIDLLSNSSNPNNIDILQNNDQLINLKCYTLLITNLTNIASQNVTLSTYILQILLQIMVLLNSNKQYDTGIVLNISNALITSYLSISKQLITSNTKYTSLLTMQVSQYIFDIHQMDDVKVTDEIIKTITLLLFDIWNKIHISIKECELKSIHIPLPFQWSTLILHHKNDTKVHLFLEIILQYLPILTSTEYGLESIQSLLPSLLIRFCDMNKDNLINIKIKMIILKIYLYLFDFIHNIEKKQLFLDLIIVPVCINISYYEKVAKNHEIVLSCGFFITSIARIIPDLFRQVILTLSESNRISLQQTMVITMQQQLSQSQHLSSSMISNNNSKNINQLKSSDSKMQINMDKYRK